jgi:hypothetical protein
MGTSNCQNGVPVALPGPEDIETFDWGSLFPDGPLVHLIKGDFEKAWEKLRNPTDCPPGPDVCPQNAGGTVEIGAAGALSKAMAKALGKNFAKTTAAQVLKGQIGYGENFLSRAVMLKRLMTQDKTGNMAAALLEDGTVVLGRSKGKSGRGGIHAEEDIVFNQAKGRKILALYSERDPCDKKCAVLLSREKVPNISWSFLHNGGAANRASGAAAHKAAMDALFAR